MSDFYNVMWKESISHDSHTSGAQDKNEYSHPGDVSTFAVEVKEGIGDRSKRSGARASVDKS